MKKVLMLLLLGLLAAVGVGAQNSTTVSGTVTEVSGAVWQDGTYTFTFVGPPSVTWPGGTVPKTITGNLSASGTYSVSVPNNNTINPSPTFWTLTVCPNAAITNASASCFSLLSQTITGAAQTLNVMPFSLVIAPGIGEVAYTSSEVAPAGMGAQFFLYKVGLQVCVGGTSTSCGTWAGAAAGSAGAPQMGFYLGNAFPTNSNNFFTTPADTQQANDCSYTSGQSTATCVAAHFSTLADVGKRVFGYNTCGAFQNLSTSNNLPLTTSAPLTISAVSADGKTITFTGGTAASTVTQGALGGCIVWGHPDDAGAAALDAAAAAAPFCVRVFLQSSFYLFTVPHFFANTPACANLSAQFPNSTAAGNMFYAAGLSLEGRGRGNTQIFLPPGFPETGTCNHGLGGIGCFVIPVEGEWQGLQITGGGNYNAPNFASGKAIVEMDGPANLENFTCSNFAVLANGADGGYGLAAYLWSQLRQVDLTACGNRGIATNISSSMTAIQVAIENMGLVGWNIGILTDYFTQNVFQFDKYNLLCIDCFVNNGTAMRAAANPTLFANFGGLKIKLIRARASAFANGCQGGQCFGFQQVTTAGGLIDVEDSYFDLSENGTNVNANMVGFKCTVSCNVIAKNTLFRGTAGGNSYVDVAGSNFTNLGGNIFTGAAPASFNGTVFEPTAVQGGLETACAVGNFALTSGWATSSVSSVAANGTTRGCHVTITGAAGSPGPVLTWTYPTVPLVAPGSCHLVGVSGTLTGVATGTPGTTNVAFTFAGTPSAQTYVFDVGCP